MNSTALGFLGIIFTFGLVILVHEFGHFIVAKLSGVKVETFSFGFGKKIWKKKWGETEYCFSIIPFGGYVQLKGAVSEEVEKYIMGTEEEAAKTEDSEASDSPLSNSTTDDTTSDPSKRTMKDSVMDDVNALRQKPYPIKVAVFIAGVTLNLIMAVLTFTFIFWHGLPKSQPMQPVIGWVEEGSAAEAAGVMTGDRIIQIGETPTTNSDEIYTALSKFVPEDQGETLILTVERNGEKLNLTVPLPAILPDESEFESIQQARAKAIYSLYSPPLEPIIADVHVNQPADKAGIKAGDVIVAINGQPIDSWYQVSKAISSRQGESLDVQLKRGEEIITTTVTPTKDIQEKSGSRGVIGIVQGNPKEITELERYPLDESFTIALNACWRITKLNFEILGRLVWRMEWKVIRENVGGPVAIGVMAYKYAQKGLIDFLQFFAAINVIIAVMNLIPFPIFDGGHIALATYESVARRPVPPRVLLAVYQASLAIIVVFAIIVTMNDVWQQFLKSLFA